MTLIDFLMIGIGGFFGAIIRYLISTYLNCPGEIPRGTLVVNLAGALLIGFVFGIGNPSYVDIAVGFRSCGSADDIFYDE